MFHRTPSAGEKWHFTSKLKMVEVQVPRMKTTESEQELLSEEDEISPFLPLEALVEKVAQEQQPVEKLKPALKNARKEKSFLPKVPGRFRIAAWTEEGKIGRKKGNYFMKDPEDQDEPEREEKVENPTAQNSEGRNSILDNNKFKQDITAGILEIFTRSIGRRVSIEKMWNELKADEKKRLKPVVLYSHKLTRKASPSAKQCLEIYRKPTAVDRYTGKPVPLGQALSEVKRKHSRSTMSIINSAMNQNIRQAQAKAELMMERKDPYNNSMTRDIHQDWYFTGVVDTVQSDAKLPTIRKRPPSSDRKPSKLSVGKSMGSNEGSLSVLKRHLPHYLTSSGSVLSASLEVNNDLMCCVPGERSKSSRLQSSAYSRDRQEATGTSSTMEWGVKGEGSWQHLTMSERSKDSTPASLSGQRKVSPMDPRSLWQPLTPAALLEHSNVTAIPIRGAGHQAHGHYSMWRPSNTFK